MPPGETPFDASQWVNVGAVSVRYRDGITRDELRKLVADSVVPYACRWGGTHMFAPILNAEDESPKKVRVPLTGPTWMSAHVTVYRKATEADTASYLKRMGIHDGVLIKRVSFDTQCAESQIAVLRKFETLGSGSYVVSACGQELKYDRQGSVYAKAP